jgi:iron(III) transport system permease protein
VASEASRVGFMFETKAPPGRSLMLASTLPLRGRDHPVAAAFIVAVAALVVIPLGNLVRIALTGDAEFWRDNAAYVLPVAIRETVLLLAGVAILTAIVGTGTAWLVTAFRFPGRGAFAWLLPLPLAIPTYIVAYIYVDICDALGPVQAIVRALSGGHVSWYPDVRSLPGAIFVFSLVLYPYVFLAARAMFQTQSASLFEVARTLGATRLMLARHVALPLARPALAVGLSLALMETLNDIGASEYLGVRTMTLSIFTTWLNRSSLPGAAQIACVMLLAVAGLIALERHGRRDRRFHVATRRSQPPAPIALAGWAGVTAAALCALPVFLGFALPAVYLVHEVIVRGLVTGFDPDLVRHTINTILLAATATAVALALGFGVVIAARLIRRPWAGGALVLAGLGYAVPGTVLALALLSPLIAIDEGLNVLSRALTGAGVGLLVAGSSAALVIAYVIRFLSIATGSAQAGLARVSTHVDDAARTLGQKPSAITRLIHIPLVRPALGGAALLVFVDCLKELSATLLLRPLNLETLSTYIYQFATRGNFEEGALAALLIVAAGIGPVIWIVRYADLGPIPEPRR